jgi:AhpD family alkylhydroperoxidase
LSSERTVSAPSLLARDVEETLKKQLAVAKEPARAFINLYNAATKPGKLDTKIKELIAVALGLMAKCEWCIAYHTKKALEAGATPDEIREAAWVAVLMCGGPCFTCLRILEEALEEFTKTKANT